MTMPVRRVVTGHDENGNAAFVSDERLAAVSRGVGTGISGCEMWSTNRMPIDNSAAADAAQRAGFVNHYIHANYVGTGAGTTFRITEFAPGHAKFTHRTETADYVVVLLGTIDIYFETAFSSARAWPADEHHGPAGGRPLGAHAADRLRSISR